MFGLSTYDTLLQVLALSVLLFIGSLIYSRRRSLSNLPPGPPGHFLIGHALKIPIEYQWRTFAEWGETYGHLIYIHVFGRPVIICNGLDTARELLEKRSHNYSDRPRMMSGELLGMGSMMTMMNYGDRWKKQRRLMQASFNQQESAAFHPDIREEINQFISDISGFEGNIRGPVHQLVSRTLCLVAYGHKVTSEEDDVVRLMDNVDEVCKAIGTPGSTLVDVIPILKYMPTWIPGLSFPSLFAKGREITLEAYHAPIALAQKEREMGTSRKALIPSLLERLDSRDVKDPEEAEDIAALGAVAFFAGSETSESTLCTFFLMMVLHPEVSERAHIELDGFIKSNRRLPSFEDKNQLPFLDCILKEVYRIHPPAPFGIPHRSVKDDIYKGWTIPSGTMIMTNIWQMMRDERYFPDPECFIPSRFMEQKENDGVHEWAADPAKVVFGFGRRACPGRYFSDDLIWLTIASTLALFDILPPLDPTTGNAVLPKVEFISAAIRGWLTIAFRSIAKPYACRIVPRSGLHESLICEIENLGYFYMIVIALPGCDVEALALDYTSDTVNDLISDSTELLARLAGEKACPTYDIESARRPPVGLFKFDYWSWRSGLPLANSKVRLVISEEQSSTM